MGNIYRYVDGDFKLYPRGLDEFSVAADGAVWGIDFEGAVHRFNKSLDRFELVASPVRMRSRLAAASHNKVWCIGRRRMPGCGYDGAIWTFDGEWRSIVGHLKAISANDKGQVFGINYLGEIFRYADNNLFMQVSGSLLQVAVGGTRVWGVNLAGEIYTYRHDQFERVPGALGLVRVGFDDHVWGLGTGKLNPYPYNDLGTVHVLNRQTEAFETIEGEKLHDIAIGPNNQIFGVKGWPCKYNGNTAAFEKISEIGLKKIVVGGDGTVWASDADAHYVSGEDMEHD